MELSLGLLGLGNKSTLFYIEQLNSKYSTIKGGFSTFPFTLYNTDFNEINNLLPKYSQDLDDFLSQYLEKLQSFKITSLIIPNITLHETIDKIIVREQFKFSIIHPLIETVKVLKANNIKTVVIFGTNYTMNHSYISSFFNESNIDVSKPSINNMGHIDTIRKDIYLGKNISNNIALLNKIISNYHKSDNILLACTELSILRPHINYQVYDMVDCQIECAIKYIMP